MDLTVSTRQKALAAYVVSPDGRIDSRTAPILEGSIDTVLQKAPQLVAMDMARTTYLSSAGIRVLIKTQKALGKSGGRLVFLNLRPQIRKVFEIIQALPSMTIFRDSDEMDAYLDQMQRSVAPDGPD